MKRVVFAKLPTSEAGPIIRDLMDREVVDLHAKIGKDDSFRYVPILPEYVEELRVSTPIRTSARRPAPP